MELPIARQSYLPSNDVLVRAIKRAKVALARTTAKEDDLDGATALTNPERSGVRCANFVADLMDSDPMGVWQRIEDHFRSAGVPCHEVYSAEEPFPAGWSTLLERAGYLRRARCVFLLDKLPGARRKSDGLQIVPARAVYLQTRQYYQQRFREHEGVDDQLAARIADAMIDHLDEPRLELYAGRLDGSVAAVSGALTLGQIGVIENTFVLASFRGRGLGPAMLSHTLEYCQRAQFEQVIVETPQGCPAIPLYESAGFKLVTTFVKYTWPAAASS